MYTRHPSPSSTDKLAFASRRMELRLDCCGIRPDDYVGRTVLDAGCGTGEYACWFAARGSRVTGIDLSDGSLAEARSYAERMNLADVVFERRSVLDTGFADASFDFIYCTGVLHHTAAPFDGLTELHRVLRPGGKILISLYNRVAFLPRQIRSRIARALGGASLDRRVGWGRRLFPFTARRLTRGERNSPDSALYDYFAIPHQSVHSVGEALRWFDTLGLVYTGTFAPARLSDYPSMFANRSYGSVEDAYRVHLPGAALRWGAKHPMTRQRPGRVSLFLAQALWLVTGVQMFCVCGRKPSS